MKFWVALVLLIVATFVGTYWLAVELWPTFVEVLYGLASK